MNSSTKELFPSELEFASQESNAKENLIKVFQEFSQNAVQTEFAVCHAFDREAVFRLKSNLQRSFNLAKI